jgi:hypothetical protein
MGDRRGKCPGVGGWEQAEVEACSGVGNKVEAWPGGGGRVRRRNWGLWGKRISAKLGPQMLPYAVASPL